MIEKIRKICEKRYNERDYQFHIIPIVKNATLLAEKLGADKEIVIAGAYLHDIGVSNFSRENCPPPDDEHHILGEKETRKILKKLKCSDEFVDKVAHCVLAHRGRRDIEPQTLEAEIIRCADAMTHFDTFLDLFDFFLKSCGSFEEALKKIESKIDRDWDKKLTLPEAKEIVKDKYEAIVLLIKSVKESM